MSFKFHINKSENDTFRGMTVENYLTFSKPHHEPNGNTFDIMVHLFFDEIEFTVIKTENGEWCIAPVETEYDDRARGPYTMEQAIIELRLMASM